MHENLLTLNKDNMTVFFEGKKGLLTYSVGNTSIIGNAFLIKNSDYDFFLDINSRGIVDFDFEVNGELIG